MSTSDGNGKEKPDMTRQPKRAPQPPNGPSSIGGNSSTKTPSLIEKVGLGTPDHPTVGKHSEQAKGFYPKPAPPAIPNLTPPRSAGNRILVGALALGAFGITSFYFYQQQKLIKDMDEKIADKPKKKGFLERFGFDLDCDGKKNDPGPTGEEQNDKVRAFLDYFNLGNNAKNPAGNGKPDRKRTKNEKDHIKDLFSSH